MSDKYSGAAAPIGPQIRRLREARGWTLGELARRAGTSPPTIHRYENGWDRFELATLRTIAAALQTRLEVWFVPRGRKRAVGPKPAWKSLVKLLAPLFWDRDLGDRADHPEWIMERVLVFGNREQVAAARDYFGDEVIGRAVERRGVDARTRNYWRLILAGAPDASESSGH